MIAAALATQASEICSEIHAIYSFHKIGYTLQREEAAIPVVITIMCGELCNILICTPLGSLVQYYYRVSVHEMSAELSQCDS